MLPGGSVAGMLAKMALDDLTRWKWVSPRTVAAFVALLLAITFAMLARAAAERELLNVDHAVHKVVQTWRQPQLDGPMRALSAVGSGRVLIPLNAVLAYVLWRRRYRNAWLIPALTLGSVATEGLIKWLVDRPRPKAVGYGFPSGHVMASIVFFGLVLYLLWRARHGDAVACIATAVGVVVVAAIGVSRIYLNAHWLSDILGAGAAGLAYLMFSILRLGPRLFERDADVGSSAWLVPDPARPRAHAGWVPAAGVVLLALVDVGTRTLATNDEARFPVLAQYLLADGNWLVPSLNGVPYVNKPPLLAWAIALVSWPIGHVTQLTAVIPSVLAGLVTVLMVYRLGRELWNTTTGRYAAAIAATTQGLFVHARLPMPDMMMTAFAAVSLWALNRMRRRPRSFGWLVFYFAVAAGFWTKGAAGLMPLGVALGYALLRRRAEPMRWLRPVPGLVVLGLLLVPWTLFATVREGDAVHRTLAVDYLRWYLPQGLSIATVVTPLEHVLSITFPWMWLVPFALYDAWRLRRGRGAEREAVILILFWAAAVFAMVCISHQQRLRYYVPLVPPLSLLLGWWLAAAVVHWRSVTLWPLRWTAALCGAAAALAIAWSVAQGRLLPEAWAILPTSRWQAAVTVAAAGTMIVAMEIGLRSRRVRRAFPVAAVAAAVLVATLQHAEETRRNAAHDYPTLVRLAQQVRDPNETVATLGVPALPIAFYLGDRVTDLTPEARARIGRAALAHDTALIVTEEAQLRARGEPAGIVARAALGRQDVVVAHVTVRRSEIDTALPIGPTQHRPVSAPPRSRHVAVELMCLIVALGAIAARTYAIRHGATTSLVYGMEAITILALASFPAHWLVFAGGVVVAGVCGYVRWHRPAFAGHPHELVGALLLLALPLDILEDVLQGSPVKADAVWLFTAAVGLVLISWTRLRGAAA